MYVIATSPRFSLGRSTPATLAIASLRFVFERRLCRHPCSSAGFAGATSWGRSRRGPSRPPPTLPLPGLVPRVLADHACHPAAPDDLTVLASRLDRRPHLHCELASLRVT